MLGETQFSNVSIPSYHDKIRNTHRHLSALAVILNVDVQIIGAFTPGVTGVAEATCLIDLAVAAEGLVVVGAYLATGIDLLVADLHANALSRTFLRTLKSKRLNFLTLVFASRTRQNLNYNFTPELRYITDIY